MICMICIQNLVKSGPGKATGILRNLRQLDAAKRQWAQDQNATGAVEITPEDLAPYLEVPPNKGWVTPVAGERYFLKSLAESPVAELTRKLEGWPKGTVLRLGTNAELEVIPPSHTPATADDPSATAANRRASKPARP